MLLQSVDGSRLRLGVNSIDLLQLYWDDYNNKNYRVVAQHLAELQAGYNSQSCNDNGVATRLFDAMLSCVIYDSL